MLQKSIGIAGTAKNTGKTTATIALLDYYHERDVRLGLTSIGYDGETVDTVTGLPKPRLFVRKGLLAVTAERCLPGSSAKVEVVADFGIMTPLGKLLGVVVEREGLLVLAGPNQTQHVRLVRDWLYQQGAQLVLVDGALSRIAPLAATDGFVLATGAAYRPDIAQIAQDTHDLALVCNTAGVAGELPWPGSRASIAWNAAGEVLAELPPSLLAPRDLDPLMAAAGEVKGLSCPALLGASCLRRLMALPLPRGMTYVFADPIKLLLGHDLAALRDFFAAVRASGGLIAYRRPLPLLAVTVNPFYPRYRYETSSYEPAYVDGGELLATVGAALEVPVVDVVQDTAECLARVVYPGEWLR